MTIFDETPALRQLLTTYFHEDWTMDRRNYRELVTDFAAGEPREIVVAAAVETRALLARPVSNEALEASLGDVGCYFYLPSASVTAREWLSNVADILESA
jgi:hypothetical protein